MNYDETINSLELGYNSVPKKLIVILGKWVYQIQRLQQLFHVLFNTKQLIGLETGISSRRLKKNCSN